MALDLDRAAEAFAASTDWTVGLEEEFGILDPHTLDLVPRFEELRDAAAADETLAASVAGELISSEIEIRSGKGETFEPSLTKAVDDPMTCGYAASQFRPYAPRARWIRTANDSYFTAMTYPEALPALLQPSDIHDAMWGIYAAVYGGAIHPTAEGHAVMAEAALPAVREVLGLPGPVGSVRGEPLPLPDVLPAQEPAGR